MLIRQNPVRHAAFEPETAHFCARLAREIIRSHDLYILRYPEARAMGYFATTSLVECIYHLALVMRYSKEDDTEHNACVAAFDQAHGILVRLSVYNNVAKRALEALNGVIRKWGSRNAPSSSNAGLGGVDALQSQIGDGNVRRPFAMPISRLFARIEDFKLTVHR